MSRPASDIKGYHAHIYYEPQTKEAAARVREGLSRFNVVLGRWHDELVGPHLKGMYQALFAPEEFAKVVPWLMLNRDGLTILLHPGTGNPYLDHTDHAVWFGSVLPLRLEALEDTRRTPASAS